MRERLESLSPWRLGDCGENAGLESERRLPCRCQQQQVVTDRRELGDELTAFRAVGQVPQCRVPLLPFGDAQRELRRQLSHVFTAHLTGHRTPSAPSGVIMAARIRVFTVPSGTPSSSLISRAVKP
jgi:hypothetical protein